MKAFIYLLLMIGNIFYMFVIRKINVKKIDEEVFAKHYAEYKLRKINKSQLAAALNISRPTLDKLLKDKGLV